MRPLPVRVGCRQFTVQERRLELSPAGAALAAVFDLNHRAHVVHWHFIQLSVPNLVVIAVMLAVFVLAIVLPFPGAERRGRGS